MREHAAGRDTFARHAGRGRPGGGGGPGGRGRHGFGPPWAQQDAAADTTGLAGWLTGRLPDGWFTGAPEVAVDRDEITVVGTLAAPEVAEGASDADRAEAEAGRISRFREETRDKRIEVAREAEHRYGRKVAWGAQCGGTRQVFTTLSVPVMTRLRQPERQVLDTLVDAGVARSRSDALAWCVRLVGSNTESWLADLRQAMSAVEEVRASGPQA